MANLKQTANTTALACGGDDWIGEREIKKEAGNWKDSPEYSRLAERWEAEGLSEEEIERRAELFGECVLESKMMDKRRKDEIRAKSRKGGGQKKKRKTAKKDAKAGGRADAEAAEKETAGAAETAGAKGTAQTPSAEAPENAKEILEGIIREAESGNAEPCWPEGAREMAGESAAAAATLEAAASKAQKSAARQVEGLRQTAASLSFLESGEDDPERKKALGDAADAVGSAIAAFEGLGPVFEAAAAAGGLIAVQAASLVSTADDRQDKVDILETNSKTSSSPPSTDHIYNGYKRDPSLSGNGAGDDPDAGNGGGCDPNENVKPDSKSEKLEKEAMEKGEKSQNQYSQRKKTGKKRGGQPKHKGKGLSKKDIEEKIAAGEIELVGTRDIGDPNQPAQSEQYEIEIQTKVVATKVVYHKGAKRTARVPALYGPKLAALCVVLMMHYGLSAEMTRECVSDLTGGVLDLSGGFVMDTLKAMDKACAGPIREIEGHLLKNPVLFTDATGSRVGKKQRWVRCVCAADAVRYYKMFTKKKEELAGLEILRDFTGTLVHDHELACYVLELCVHSECDEHGIRRLTKASVETGHPWAGDMIGLLYKMKRTRDGAKSAGKGSLEEPVLDSLLDEFSQVLERGRAENKASRFLTPKRVHYERSLIDDLQAYRSQYLRFLFDFSVPFTNNLSEQALRRIAARRRKIGCFRTEEGLARYCDIMSVIGTARKMGMPMLKTVTEIISGNFGGFGFGAD